MLGQKGCGFVELAKDRGRHQERARGRGRGSATGSWWEKSRLCRSGGWLGGGCMGVAVGAAG